MSLHSPEKINAFLDGIDVQRNRMIAATLGELGPDGIEYLPRLFELVRAYYLRIPHEDIRTVQVVAWGSRSMGTLVHCAGYNGGIHDSILSWLLKLSHDPHPLLAELAVWGLGDLGTPPEAARERLLQIAKGSLRPREPTHATIRSVAFRMLARTSRQDAERLRHSSPAEEYLRSVDNWIRELVETDRSGNWAHTMHINESAWLRADPWTN